MFVPHSGDETQSSHRRDTSLVGETDSKILCVSDELLIEIGVNHPELERLILDGMLARVAYEYRHWIRHAVVANEH
eukprot:622807-Pleurochrysis_carterae.AAC.1